ncbi:DUF6896 domain-containing protein [Endozoicomonas arenosclerae]|uniref:DUF6896 domain-containing protein n=1 Tax=Endozoicomonas arenosclerae TaxID=1633495 RepID=UPI0007822A0C|nr:hypothetical protein [Endozoicomonas arenosclerae]
MKTIDMIRKFICLQSGLMSEFRRQFPDCQDYRFLLDFPKKGHINYGGYEWSFIKHGAGLLFVNQSNHQEIDINRSASNPIFFDIQRIKQYFESQKMCSNCIEDDIYAAIEEGKVIEIDHEYKLLKLK